MSDRLRHLDLTAAGEPYRPVHAGNGLIYDGVANYTQSTNFPMINSTTAMTVFFVFEAQTSGWPTIQTMQISGIRGTGMEIRSNVFFCGNNSLTSEFTYIINSISLLAGQKYQVMMTYDGSQVMNASSAAYYVNGQKDNSTYFAGSGFPNSCDPGGNTVYLNTASSPSAGQTLGGYLASKNKKIQMINRVLTAQEIRETFNRGTMIGVAANNEFLIAMDFDKVSGNPTNEISITGSDTNELAWTHLGGAPNYASFF